MTTNNDDFKCNNSSKIEPSPFCREEWNAFVGESPNGHFFQSFEFGEIRSTLGWEPIRIAVEDEGGIKAAISILKIDIPIIKSSIFYAPRGPVINFRDRELLHALLKGVREAAQRENAVFLKIDTGVPVEERDVVEILKEAGFIIAGRHCDKLGTQPTTVFRINLQKSLEEIEGRFDKTTRRNIRISEKKGVIVQEDNSKEGFDAFLLLLMKMVRHKKIAAYDAKYYRDIWEILYPHRMGRLFLARYNGKIVAGVFVYLFGKKCWLAYSAFDNRYGFVCPNQALHLHVIKWAKEKGCPWYDLRGTGIINPDNAQPGKPFYGLYIFKKGFGPEFVRFIPEMDMVFRPGLYKLWNFSIPLMEMGVRVYANLRRFRCPEKS